MRILACTCVVGLALAASACSREAPTAAAEPVAAAPSEATMRHPCALLSDATVAEVAAGAQAGQPETEDERYGISACHWETPQDPVMLQTFNVGPGALVQELRSAALEVVDIRRPDAASLVRLESMEGIADLAGGYVEAADQARGIRRASAVVMVQRGPRLAVLRIPHLAGQDRPAALATMRRLATEIAQGL